MYFYRNFISLPFCHEWTKGQVPASAEGSSSIAESNPSESDDDPDIVIAAEIGTRTVEGLAIAGSNEGIGGASSVESFVDPSSVSK